MQKYVRVMDGIKSNAGRFDNNELKENIVTNTKKLLNLK